MSPKEPLNKAIVSLKTICNEPLLMLYYQS